MPHVVVHNAVSLDGRIDGFDPDYGRYVSLTEEWDVDAHLVGSDTLLADTGRAVPDGGRPTDGRDGAEGPAEGALLVVPDSAGRIQHWDELLAGPYWADGVALVTDSTPDGYRSYLDREGVDTIVAGEQTVDLGAALARLEADHGVETLLVDSGGTLSGHLLREDLVDELSVLVHPVAVGGTEPRSFLRGPDGEAVTLALENLQKVDDLLWLRYSVAG